MGKKKDKDKDKNAQKCKKVKNPCKICLQPVASSDGIQCAGACETWVHYDCADFTPGKIRDIEEGLINVTCPCPDCKTKDPKEQLTEKRFTCNNVFCPANNPPSCEEEDCQANEVSRKKPARCPPPGALRTCGPSCQKYTEPPGEKPAPSDMCFETGTAPTPPPPCNNESSNNTNKCFNNAASCPPPMAPYPIQIPSETGMMICTNEMMKQMCRTMGTFTQQLNDLMDKMKTVNVNKNGGPVECYEMGADQCFPRKVAGEKAGGGCGSNVKWNGGCEGGGGGGCESSGRGGGGCDSGGCKGSRGSRGGGGCDKGRGARGGGRCDESGGLRGGGCDSSDSGGSGRRGRKSGGCESGELSGGEGCDFNDRCDVGGRGKGGGGCEAGGRVKSGGGKGGGRVASGRGRSGGGRKGGRDHDDDDCVDDAGHKEGKGGARGERGAKGPPPGGCRGCQADKGGGMKKTSSTDLKKKGKKGCEGGCKKTPSSECCKPCRYQYYY